MTTVEAIISALPDASTLQKVQEDMRKLRGAYEWGLKQQPVAAGEHAIINDRVDHYIEPASGWDPWRHLFTFGTIVEVVRVEYNPYAGRWYADIMFDTETVKSRVHSQLVEVPHDRRHSFSVPCDWLQR